MVPSTLGHTDTAPLLPPPPAAPRAQHRLMGPYPDAGAPPSRGGAGARGDPPQPVSSAPELFLNAAEGGRRGHRSPSPLPPGSPTPAAARGPPPPPSLCGHRRSVPPIRGSPSLSAGPPIFDVLQLHGHRLAAIPAPWPPAFGVLQSRGHRSFRVPSPVATIF
ncbi:hypothetical protein LUU34_01610600 [Aix galericulata]|nr:hypothetical protein LUU34_01610600 [Aix galericulata]